jgi:hypothetical protein
MCCVCVYYSRNSKAVNDFLINIGVSHDISLSANSNSLQGTISMTIYTVSSERALPYVYMGVHPVTGEFYVGSRTAKDITYSHLDLRKYKTSSQNVKHRFNEFEWSIVAEFFTGNDAYDYEQELIYNTWNNPLSLNETCYYGKQRFRMRGPRTKEHSEKIGKAHKGKIVSQESRQKAVQTRRENGGWTITEETRAKFVEIHTGMKHTEESKQKMRKPKAPFTDEHRAKIKEARALQVIPKQAIVTCPHCGKQGGSGTMPRWHFDRCKHKPI